MGQFEQPKKLNSRIVLIVNYNRKTIDGFIDRDSKAEEHLPNIMTQKVSSSREEDDVSVLEMDRYGEDPSMMRTLRQARRANEAILQHSERFRMTGFMQRSNSQRGSDALCSSSPTVPKVIKVKLDTEADELPISTISSPKGPRSFGFNNTSNNKSNQTVSTHGSSSSREPHSPRPDKDTRKHGSHPPRCDRMKKSASERTSKSSSSKETHHKARVQDKTNLDRVARECHSHGRKPRSLSPKRTHGRRDSRSHTSGHNASVHNTKQDHVKGPYLDTLFGSSHTKDKSSHSSKSHHRPKYIDRLFDNSTHTLPSLLSNRRRRSKVR